jgi:hypothetical protein
MPVAGDESASLPSTQPVGLTGLAAASSGVLPVPKSYDHGVHGTRSFRDAAESCWYRPPSGGMTRLESIHLCFPKAKGNFNLAPFGADESDQRVLGVTSSCEGNMLLDCL